MTGGVETQSHANDWLRLHTEWLAAAAPFSISYSWPNKKTEIQTVLNIGIHVLSSHRFEESCQLQQYQYKMYRPKHLTWKETLSVTKYQYHMLTSKELTEVLSSKICPAFTHRFSQFTFWYIWLKYGAPERPSGKYVFNCMFKPTVLCSNI